MTTRIQVNGVEILAEAEAEAVRNACFAIATTQNVTAKGLSDDLSFVGGASFAEVIRNAGNSTDVVEFSEKPKGAEDWTLKARYVREKFANRVVIASTRDEYTGEIFTGESEKKNAPSVPQVIKFG